jgi:hypothetical protein
VTCANRCHEIGGPWVSYDPNCPVHGDEAREAESRRSLGRFVLFGGQDLYPDGGAHDLVGRFVSIEEAESEFNPSERDWGHVYDLERDDIVSVWEPNGWRRQ